MAPLELDAVRTVWNPLIKKLGVRLGVPLSQAERFLATLAPNVLAIRLPAGYNGSALECDTPEARARIEQVLGSLLHRPVSLQFERTASPDDRTQGSAAVSTSANRRDEVEADPIVRKVVELFEARPLHVEYEDETP